MSWDLLFTLVNAVVVPAWLLLVFAPGWRTTRLVVHSGIYPLILGTVYAVGLIASMFFGLSSDGAGMTSTSAVAALFDHPNGVIVGWTHYLVFDLFVGAWIGRDARRLGLAHLSVVPCLIAAFLFGPVGLAAYFLIRIAQGHGIGLSGEDTGEPSGR